jgi:hypothetical protein
MRSRPGLDFANYIQSIHVEDEELDFNFFANEASYGTNIDLYKGYVEQHDCFRASSSVKHSPPSTASPVLEMG